MDSSFLTIVAVARGFFTLLVTTYFLFHRKFKSHQENKTIASSLSPPSSFPLNRKHHIFPSFHGADVRKSFLSHILKEFRSKGIDPFIDNDIERSKSIGPELIDAIRGSRIAIVFLSRNYSSSTWCMNELVEIMKCREELGQILMTIFYQVDPTDVKKQTGDFGKVFRKTCKGMSKEDIGRWRQALVEVAKIAGYHSQNWDNDARMIETIVTDVSNKLNYSTLSTNFDGLVGMRAHMDQMRPILRLELNEVRIIGIWGPSGIGKTTIARSLFNQYSKSFQLSVFIENIKARYTRPACSDEYNVKLYLQEQFMSQIINQVGIKIPHLGIAKDRLKDKKVLVVLDDVDQLVQLEAMVKETCWFGPWSRIIITTQDKKLLRAHGIKHIYTVDLPSSDEALQMFCKYAFGQNYPVDGFEKLAEEVTKISGKLPLGLRVMGFYLRGMSKQEWKKALPRLRTRLDGEIESILKFSYDALCDDYKDLFLHIACFFKGECVETLEMCLANSFLDVTQGIHVLVERSLISLECGRIKMHNLLVHLGREIVRKEFVSEPGKRQFLVDPRDICEVLTDDTSGSRSIIGINLGKIEEDIICTSGRVFEKMSSLQFLRVFGYGNRLHFQQNLNSISRKLVILDWMDFPMPSLPSNFNPKFLVKLHMQSSKLETLWEGIQPLSNLKWMNLDCSKYLKGLPDLSTATSLRELTLRECSRLANLPSSIGNATNLEKLDLFGCSSLVDLSSSIENAINLKELDLSHCSSLVKLPSSIGNALNLTELDLSECTSLLELPSSIGNANSLKHLDLIHCLSLTELPSSIGNATNLTYLHLSHCSSLLELPSSIGNLHELLTLNLEGCSKLETLPTNINMKSLNDLDLTDCLLIKRFPQISTSIKYLRLLGTSIEEVPSSIRLWPSLYELHMPYSEKLHAFPLALESITMLYLRDIDLQELGPWIERMSRLRGLDLKGCRKLILLPKLPSSLLDLDAEDCESLERLDCSSHNPEIRLNFGNCFKLNQEARDLIMHTSTHKLAILPGEEVPAYFTNRASGSSLTVKLGQKPLRTSTKFKACILLVNEGEYEVDEWQKFQMYSRITSKLNDFAAYTSNGYSLDPILTEHLYTFEVEVDEATTTEIVIEFKLRDWGKDTFNITWKIKECGIFQLFEVR
ncbi:unnamed protein product [Microthlaspi erraticum]|uniref:ADP-ribosyl cyclase/cyclic ADP-ribose hydrolase n=1 Tax=Microthlaspi erraticum TaxID=1685480 RepID=A0A6D2KMG4_9BRAS|nr:unnamed protein product [Microthlaspi erraticum]